MINKELYKNILAKYGKIIIIILILYYNRTKHVILGFSVNVLKMSIKEYRVISTSWTVSFNFRFSEINTWVCSISFFI